jgi:hypothetical protein
LKILTTPAVFSWNFLPVIGTVGGSLGARDDALIVNNFSRNTFSVSCVMQEKKLELQLEVVGGIWP